MCMLDGNNIYRYTITQRKGKVAIRHRMERTEKQTPTTMRKHNKKQNV